LSDNKTRFQEVRKALDKFYPTQPKGNFARNLNTLAALVSGIVGSKSTQLPQIAGKVPEAAQPTSVEKRMKRFVINKKVDDEQYFTPYAKALLREIDSPEIVLAMDGSTVGRGCCTLMVSVIYKKRALPLAYIVVKGKKGHFPEESHIALAQKVYEMLPDPPPKVVFLGDGEFDGTELQRTLNQWGWAYVCRTAHNIKVFRDEEEFDIGILGSFLPQGTCKGMKDVLYTRKKYGPVTIVGWWGEDSEEPIYLVTNMRFPAKACEYYSKRFRIETFFSDQKSRGFSIDKSHLSDPDRLSRLMMAACLAYIWIIFFRGLGNAQGT
jgi:hypothetical protein